MVIKWDTFLCTGQGVSGSLGNSSGSDRCENEAGRRFIRADRKRDGRGRNAKRIQGRKSETKEINEKREPEELAVAAVTRTCLVFLLRHVLLHFLQDLLDFFAVFGYTANFLRVEVRRDGLAQKDLADDITKIRCSWTVQIFCNVRKNPMKKKPGGGGNEWHLIECKDSACARNSESSKRGAQTSEFRLCKWVFQKVFAPQKMES